VTESRQKIADIKEEIRKKHCSFCLPFLHCPCLFLTDIENTLAGEAEPRSEEGNGISYSPSLDHIPITQYHHAPKEFAGI